MEAVETIKSIANPSKFDLGTETVSDSNIRVCSELDNKKFSILFNGKQNEPLSSKDHSFLEQIRQSLSPQTPFIVAEPYKFLLYEKGSFFKSHVDTPRTKNQFGSLIVSLPVAQSHKGGDFLLYFADDQMKWNKNGMNNECECEYIAFYSDVQHEIKPITEGVRCVITLNLMAPDDLDDVPSLEYSSQQQIVAAISDSQLGKDMPYEIIAEIVELLGNFEAIPMMKKLFDDSRSRHYVCFCISDCTESVGDHIRFHILSSLHTVSKQRH